MILLSSTACRKTPIASEAVCTDPIWVRLELVLGIPRTPLSGARVTETTCARAATTDSTGRVSIPLAREKCSTILVDHPSTLPTAIGSLRGRANQAETLWELSPRNLARPLGFSEHSAVLLPRWFGTRGDGAGIRFTVVDHPEAVVTYFDRTMRAIPSAKATVEGKSAFVSISGVTGGRDVKVVVEKPGMRFAVNPDSHGMCESVPVLAGRVTLFRVQPQ